MLSVAPAYATTVYDAAGNTYQMYPNRAIYPTAVPITSPDMRSYETIPHRIFVGGFPAATSELELRTFFEQFGHVREVKVIRSSEGTSKGYGFITFDTEEEAKAIMRSANDSEGTKLEFKGRRLNLGPAVRRLVHPRISQEYFVATSGQLFAANSLGSYYVYPQSPVMMVQPPFVFPSPVSGVGQTQLQYPTTEGTEVKMQQPQQGGTFNSQVTAVAPLPSSGTPQSSPSGDNAASQQQVMTATASVPVTFAQPIAQYCSTPNGVQQFTQMSQPLTPITPSNVAQRGTVVPQGAAYYAQIPPATDMTHYSQMTAHTYYYAPNNYQQFDASGQPVAVLAPVTQAIPQAVAAPPSTGQQRYDEVQMAWQNTPNSEVRHSSTPRRSPVKSLVPLTNRFSQMSVQGHQHYDRKDGHSTGSPGTSKQYQ